MSGWRLVSIALLLCLAVPASAQISLDAEPAQGPAPLESLLTATAERNLDIPWRIFFTSDGQTHEVANGTQLPAEVLVRFEEAGTYHIRLLVDNGTQVTSTTVQVLEPLSAIAAPPAPVSGEVIPLLVAGTMMLALASWLLRHDHRNPINIAFAVLFIARGVADITLALWTNGGSMHIRPGGGLDASTGGLIVHLHPLTSIVVMGAALHFLYTYLAQNRAWLAMRRRRFSTATGVATALVVVAYLAVPSLWWTSSGLPGGPLFIITGLYYPLYAVFALLLFRESVADIPDARRRGAFLSGLGFLFLPVFSGVGDLIFVDILDYFGRTASIHGFDRGDLSLGFEIGHYAAILALIPAAAAGFFLARDALRGRAGAHRYLGLYLLAILLPLLSLAAAVAVFHGGSVQAARDAFSLFAFFQGVWTIPYAVLVAIGIASYQEAERQSLMRKQLRRFTLASIFVAVFFAVSEGVEAMAASSSGTYGTWSGLAAAAAMTLLLNPIQQAVQRSLLAEPGETTQELRFYREQVRRTLSDGTIGTTERKFLRNLQETMGLRQETAARIELDLLGELGLRAA